MRRIRINDLTPGMEVGRSIFNSDGRTLLAANSILTESYILRLEELGIYSVYVKDEFSEDIDIPDVISEQTRIQTIKLVKNTFKLLEQERKINVRMAQNVVNNLIDELLANNNVLISLSDIHSFDDSTFAHSVNVCILSIMTGITLRYNDLKLKELGMGALLHDVGKTRVDKNILNKADDLSKEEYREIKKHAQYGFDILRQYKDISLLSAHVAYQHHESWNGKGYPRKLCKEEIHEYARIVAVADVYDALMDDRPYRASYSVNQAITILKRMAGVNLDPRCTSALISNIAIYPIGTMVELNIGSIAVVVDVNKEMPTRPIVKVIYEKSNMKLCHAHEVDLSKMSTVMITRTLNEADLKELIKK